VAGGASGGHPATGTGAARRAARSVPTPSGQAPPDKIPAIITAAGGQPVTRVLDDAGYEAALRAKLLEEAHEAQAATDGQLAAELADVLEVLQALTAAHHMSWEDIVSEAGRKRAERGGFDDRIFLEHVDQAR
jgi:predicted house-cleaning noncanonical NTP pyrophosphatase (MazG superfamily)